MSGQSGGRIRLAKLNDQLTCKLCGGYFIDATTIIECLHSFCRSCIVKYLETNKYCPICEVQVHKSKPLLNIRPDHTLQDIVYKLVPGCYQNEMRCRREFYEKHPEAQLSTMSPEARGEPIESHIYSPDESLSLSLEYYNPNFNENSVGVVPVDDSKDASSALGINSTAVCPGKIQARRYLRCPAAVTVFHLQKLIRAKHGLSDAHRVDVMYKEESLCGNYTLMDVMYIYHWRRKVPLHLSYRIFESSPKRLKLSDDNAHFKETMVNAGISEPKDESMKKEWKEVQLKISETGVMSVTGIHTSPETKKAKVETLEEEQRRLDESVAAATAAVVTAEKKQETNLASDSDTNSANSPLPEPPKATEKSTTSSSSSSSSSIDIKPVSANNNNSNSNNFNSKTDMGGASTRDKHKNSPMINDTKSNQLPSSSGSKIDAVSAKLQFQPKVGQVNNTYSKKSLKEKRGMLEKVLKKSEAKNSVMEGGQKVAKSTAEKNRPMSSATTTTTPITTSLVSKSSSQQSKTPTSQSANTGSTLLDASTSNTVTSTYSTISTPSVSISISSRRNSSPERNKESSTASNSSSSAFIKRRPSSGDAAEGCNQRSHISTTSSASPKVSFVRQLNNLPPSTESLEKIGLNVSTAILGLCSSGTSATFPYSVQDLVNNAMLKSPSRNMASGSSSLKQSTATSSSLQQGPSSSQLTLQTPSMSVYSIPSVTKNNPVTSNNSGKTKCNVDITAVYSMPPCPDGIPISLMKPTVRKTEILAKGTNINDICAKMSTSGSKINDICAKIGENSKEKIKSETRSRPDVPDLLKITKKAISSISNDSTTKHIPNIPNVPIYTPSNSVSADSKSIYLIKDTIKISTSTSSSLTSTSAVTSTSSSNTSTSSSPGPTTLTSPAAAAFQASGKSNSFKKSQSQSVSYKTLRDPPKPWNPTLSNNYVAAKNQAKEMQSQTQSMLPEMGSGHSSASSSGKNIASKPAKILKMRNTPRFLGNPLSGVKPMYSENNDGKDSNKDQTKLSSPNPPSSSKSSSSGPSMTKIDPKTLSPIVSTNTNSPIVSPPPYSPNARSYQNTPFSRSSNSPMSPRSTSVNMLSTNPFIPSGKPNTNPRLFYSPFPPPFPDSSRFTNPLIRSAMSIPPSSAFHSSLPPTVSKIYSQRTSYLPQTTSATYSQQNLLSQPPTVQRIPPSTHSSSPKSPKTTVASSTFNLAKTETQTSIPTSIDNTVHIGKTAMTQESNAFNLSKTGGSNYASDLSKTSTLTSVVADKSAKSPNTTSGQTKLQEKLKDNSNAEEKPDPEEQSDSSKKKKQDKEKKNVDKKDAAVKNSVSEVDNSSEVMSTVKSEESATKVNGSPSVQVMNTSETKEISERPSEDDDKSSEKIKDMKNVEGKNSMASEKSNIEDKDVKHEDGLKSSEHIQTKKSDTQRNKAES